MSFPRLIPPVPNTIKDVVEKQFFEKMRQTILQIQTDTSGVSGAPPYLSLAGGTMTGDITLGAYAGHPSVILAVDAYGKISLTNKTIGDLIQGNFVEITGDTMTGNLIVPRVLYSAPVEIHAPLISHEVQANDFFGSAVAMSQDGSVLAVSAPQRDLVTGIVYIFDWNGSMWVEREQVQSNDATTTEAFGTGIALSANGDVLIVGAQFWDGTFNNQGSVYTFDFINGKYVQRGLPLTAADAATSDQHGVAVATNSTGTTLVVGAQAWEGSLTNQGAVYVYDWNGSSWVKRGDTLVASDPASNDYFGTALAMSPDGTILLVGAYQWEGISTNQGAVYRFMWNGYAWVEQTILYASDASSNDSFGNAIALSQDGNILAVGAYDKNVTYNYEGQVYIYDWDGDSYVERLKFNSPDPSGSSEGFGSGIAFNADASFCVVGAKKQAVNAGQGVVYTFALDPVGRPNTHTGNGNVGFGTPIANKKVEINDENGEALRLSHNNNEYVDFDVSSTGDLTINPSGYDTINNGTFTVTSISGANGSLVSVDNAGKLSLSGISSTSISGIESTIGDHEGRISALEGIDNSGYALTSTVASISGTLQSQITNNDNDINGLIAISGNHESRIDTLESYDIESRLDTLESYDHSVFALTSTVASISGNIQDQITGLVAISGDHESRIDNLEAYDHSVFALTSTVASISGNLQNQITTNDNDITGLQAISGNHEARIDALEAYDDSGFVVNATLASISGNLQDQITSNDNDIINLNLTFGEYGNYLLTVTNSIDTLNSKIIVLTDADIDIYSTIGAISGDLQDQITSNDGDISDLFDITSGLIAISGDHDSRIIDLENYDHSIYALQTTVDSISGQVLSNNLDILNLRTDVNTISGDLDILETYTSGITGGLTQLDDRFINVDGDTMTGPFSISNATHSLDFSNNSNFLRIDTSGDNAILDLKRAGTSRLIFSGNDILSHSSVTKFSIEGTTESDSISGGQLQVKGGAGFMKNVNVGGTLSINDVTFTNTISGGTFTATGDFLKIITPSGDRYLNLYEII